jgi:multidrug resistance efflux pump
VEGRWAYEEKVARELEQADDVVRRWRAIADAANEEAETEYRQQIEAVENIRERAWSHLQELKAAEDETWVDLQPRLEGILSELRSAVANAGFSIVE